MVLREKERLTKFMKHWTMIRSPPVESAIIPVQDVWLNVVFCLRKHLNISSHQWWEFHQLLRTVGREHAVGRQTLSRFRYSFSRLPVGRRT